MKSFKLDDIDKNEKPFTVPDGYFEDLPMKIQSRIEAKPKESWVRTPAFRLAFSFAAVVAIVLSVLTLLSESPTPEQLLADIPEEDLLAYIDLVQLEESDILSAFEGGAEGIEFFGSESLEDIDLGEETLDDILLEYDLSEEYL